MYQLDLFNIVLSRNCTDKVKVLYYLLKSESINYNDFHAKTKMINLSARIADLRNDHFLDIPCTTVKYKNEFGKSKSYGSWKLINKDKGIELYKKLTKN